MSNLKTSAQPATGGPLLTAAQMRAAEAALIETGRATGHDLMERAARGVVAAICDTWPDLAHAPHRAVVLCGPGNNGGDGYAVARLLADRGWSVAVHALGDGARLPPDAAAQRALWAAQGPVAPLDVATASAVAGADLVVDAIFGTGLSRGFALPPGLAAALSAARAPRVVAVDIPSGLDADSGRMLAVPGGQGAPIRADLTVTFHAPKLGHVLAEGPGMCGHLVVVDIGLGVGPDDPKLARQIDLRADARARAALAKGGGGHKYRHGHALVLSGPMGRSGAARLAARGALRVGAGVVTVAAPDSAMLENACQLTAIMLRRCDGAADLAALLADHRINAACLGPGMGLGQGAVALVGVALAQARPLGLVLDADALSGFAGDPAALFAMTRAAGAVVLTPHDGEFARLFPDLAERLAAPAPTGPAFSRLDAVRAAAARAGCVVLLKGPDTVIAAPDGRAAVHVAAYGRAAPWLATAGAGDVLAGLITGLLARGFAALEAAKAAAWLHVEAARQFGPGLTAEDLTESLPRVLRDLAP